MIVDKLNETSEKILIKRNEDSKESKTGTNKNKLTDDDKFEITN